VTPGVRTLRIGVTGPIGCGKSQVVRWLSELGVHVVDADAEARAVTAPGHPTHDLVLRRWPEAAAPDGTLDRRALGRIVFDDPAALRELEQIVHPAVRPRILARIDEAERAGAPAVVIEAIKLVEGGLAAHCDEVWLVSCDPHVQRHRLVDRGLSREEADQRMAAQAGLVERLRPAATRSIDTSASTSVTRARVVDALAASIAERR
jgi:dephospho-CoA kinase